MAEERVVETTTQPHTTVIERSGSGGGLLIGLAVLIAVLIGGYFLMTMSNQNAAKTSAVTSAADKVGGAADKVGDAASGGK